MVSSSSSPCRPRIDWLAGVLALLLVTGCSTINAIQKQHDAQANLNEADRQLTLGHMDQARTWSDRAVASDPDNSVTYVGAHDNGIPGLVDILAGHGDYPDVVHYLTAAAARPKVDRKWVIYQSLADAQLHLDNIPAEQQAARSELAEIGKTMSTPGSTLESGEGADLLTAKADAEWEIGDQSNALKDYSDATETYLDKAPDVENDEAYFEALSKTRLPEALTLAKKAVAAARKKDDEVTLSMYLDTQAWVEHQMGDDQSAVVDEEQSEELMPREGDIAYHLAVIYQALGRNQDAEVEYQRAITLQPFNPDARQALAELTKPAPAAARSLSPSPAATGPSAPVPSTAGAKAAAPA